MPAIAVIALWLLTQFTIVTMSDAAVERAVDVDLAGLVDIYASGGQQELVKRIEDRTALTDRSGNAARYLLAANDGQILAGDIDRWPALDARLSQAGKIDLPSGIAAHARATQLGPDLRLLVAQELGDTSALQHRIALVFLAAGSLLVGAIGWLGRAAMRRLAVRIARINDAFRSGDRRALIGTAPDDQHDEIDELTSHSASAIEQMERLVEAHRETSDQVAHEIRTPLMHIDSKLVKALNDHPESAVSDKIIAAREDMKRLIAMLESLLDIASSKARQGDRHGMKQFDLSDLMRRIGELYNDSAEESGHLFDCQITPGISFEGEEAQITRLITNLLDNALKYTPSGCAITLSLAPGPVLAVTDNGPGVPENKRDRIFDRFSRGESAPDGAYGAGLGLALAKAIAERHGLSLRLDYAAKGARFIVGRVE